MKSSNKFLKSVSEDQYIVSKAFNIGIGNRNIINISVFCKCLVSAGHGGLVNLRDI